MARPGRKARPAGETKKTTPPSGNGNGKAAKRGRGGEGQSTSGYFREIFLANRKLLRTRSNAALMERWLADHPGEESVPKSVKECLANVKSQLRQKLRKRKGRRLAEETQVIATEPASATPAVDLETLEIQIDECLTLAKNIDREALQEVIGLLRRARNEVVWKTGQ